MREPRRTALPSSPEEWIRWQQEDLDDRIEARANTAAVLAFAKFCEHQRKQPKVKPKKIAKRDRGLGVVQEQAVMAGISVIIDQFNTIKFPDTPHGIARAIASRTAELGLKPDLDPYSTSVRSVAATFLKGARASKAPRRK